MLRPRTSMTGPLCRLSLVTNSKNTLKMGPTRLLAWKMICENWIHMTVTMMESFVFKQPQSACCLIDMKMILNMTLQPTKSVWSPPGMATLETSEQASGCLPARLHRLLLYSSSAEHTRLHPYLLNVTHKMRLVPATSPRLWATEKFRTKEGIGQW